MSIAHDPNQATADELFQFQLNHRGLSYERSDDGLYQICLGTMVATIDFENIRRNYERDRDLEAITRFADNLNADLFPNIPDWSEVSEFIRYSIESSAVTKIDNFLYESVTEKLVKIYVFTSADGSKITWITDWMLNDWGIYSEDAIERANSNMNQLVAQTKLEIEDMDNFKLGLLSTEEIAFKASLVLSPQFQKLVSPVLGWPVFAVIPARDFAYIIPSNYLNSIDRLGEIVLREYNSSGYPITPEVLEISDDGIVEIGTFSIE